MGLVVLMMTVAVVNNRCSLKCHFGCQCEYSNDGPQACELCYIDGGIEESASSPALSAKVSALS